MHLALTDLFRAKWTAQIHAEWKRTLLTNRPDLKVEQIDRTQELMDRHVRDCLVTDFENLVPSIQLPDADDRHVVAAAIVAGASTIVTFNLKDFPAAEIGKYGIEAQHPDEFIVHQMGLSQATVCLAAKRHRATLRNPAKTVDEYLNTLEMQGLPQTAGKLREFSDLI
jgi:hypothetical protein